MDLKKSSILSGVRSMTMIKALVVKHMMEIANTEASTLLQSNHIIT